jgi:hypothetical protein
MEDGTCHKKSCHLAIWLIQRRFNTGVSVITIYCTRLDRRWPVTGNEVVTVLSFRESHTLAQHGSTNVAVLLPSTQATWWLQARSQPRLLNLAPTVEAARGKNLGRVRKILPPW